MLTKTISIQEKKTLELTEKLSLESFYRFLDHFIENDNPADGIVPLFTLERIQEIAHTHGKFSAINIAPFQEIFQTIYSLNISIIDDNTHLMWALGFPAADKVFYGTDDFYALFNSKFVEQSVADTIPITGNISNQARLIYAQIFERLYGLPAKDDHPIVYHELNENGEIINYYDLFIDFKFVDIKPKASLPKIDFNTFSKNENDITVLDWDLIQKFVNLNDFEISGFTILKFQKTTIDHIVEKLQNIRSDISFYDSHKFSTAFHQAVLPLFLGAKTQYSLFPLFYLNNQPILEISITNKSIIIPPFANSARNHQPEIQQIIAYLKAPFPIFYNAIEGMENTETDFIDRIKQAGVKAYLCFPLINKNKLAGILELYSYEDNYLKNDILTALKPIVPILTKLSFDVSLQIKKRLNDIIINRFTTIQPAVQWKFNQVAAKYLQDIETNQQHSDLKPVAFEDVFPLYGAIDIKDSTIIRNTSILKDFSSRVKQLGYLIDVLSEHSDRKLITEFSKKVDKITASLDHLTFDESMVRIIEFFRKDVIQFLEDAHQNFPEKNDLIDHYSKHFIYDRTSGELNRNEFETALQGINKMISEELELLNDFIQGNYPSYFQKFRSDGIEYDIYVGQSITPQEKFHQNFINIFRRQQIISMARIAIRAAKLQQKLSLPLQTTQLIFINPHTIDISFREDERRFDVEGSLNIRYEIIKKRIDKIKVKATKERLTQVNKIAIVYLSDDIIPDLKESIDAIYKLGLITAEIAYLTLEDVQGVSGLKAIRLTVNQNIKISTL